MENHGKSVKKTHGKSMENPWKTMENGGFNGNITEISMVHGFPSRRLLAAATSHGSGRARRRQHRERQERRTPGLGTPVIS